MSEPQKLVWSGCEEIIEGLISPETGQKSLTVKAMQSVTLLMHKVWKFITPHIITEHTKDPGALRIPLASVSLPRFYTLSASLSLPHSLPVAEDDERLGSTQSSLYTSNP